MPRAAVFYLAPVVRADACMDDGSIMRRSFHAVLLVDSGDCQWLIRLHPRLLYCALCLSSVPAGVIKKYPRASRMHSPASLLASRLQIMHAMLVLICVHVQHTYPNKLQ